MLCTIICMWISVSSHYDLFVFSICTKLPDDTCLTLKSYHVMCSGTLRFTVLNYCVYSCTYHDTY